MKTRNAITKLINKTLAAATLIAASLLYGTSLLQPVQAQTDGSVRFVSYATIGIVPGERVRLSVANTEESAGNLTLSFSYYLAHQSNSSSNVPLYESDLITVPRGEFRFSDVSRKDLNTEGEPETGRAQVMVKVTMIAPAGSNPEDFPCSLEIIEEEAQDGQSVQTDSKYRLIILAAKRSKQLAPIGFLPGERLSYTFFNPNEDGSQPIRVQAYVYDATGRLLMQTDPVELKPGHSYTANINRDDLRVAGERVTGRLQVRTGIQAVLIDGSVRPFKLSISMERVDNRTGGSSGGDYYTGTVSVSGDGF